MGLFKQIADPLTARNVPVIPLRPRTKIAFIAGWEQLATTDVAQVDKWDAEYTDANGACVAYAKPDGVWFFEVDKPGIVEKIEQETGHALPETFMVRSSPGRGHFYFKQTPASIAMGNVQGKDEQGKESWSARVDRRYVVAPGSFHPTSGRQYETILDTGILPAPDWFVDWCRTNSVAANGSTPRITGHAELDSNEPIAEGGRNSAVTSILGKARQLLGMGAEELFQYGLSVNQRCVPPLPDSEIRTIANSMARYEVKPSGVGTVLLNGKVVGGETTSVPSEPVQPVAIKAVPYPVFPRWVMKGTSIGDGLVEPTCSINSRYPEYMFMPAMTMVLNYLGQKVTVKDRKMVPSFYMISVGRKGRVIKSASVTDAIEYLSTAGIIGSGGPTTRTADGRSLVYTVGSGEGLGLEMTRANCKNAILFYDELSTLVNKASIEGSSLSSNLLTMYESDKFSNVIKSRKEAFNFDAKTYCVSLIACTTDKNFQPLWSKMSGGSSGLDDRFFFLYQPEVLDPLKVYRMPNAAVMAEAALNTRKLIDKAVKQSVYEIEDDTMLDANIGALGNRTMHRVEKMALFFAIDMGKTVIDDSCIERAIAIAKYELAVKKYLNAFEAKTAEGALQGEIIQYFQRNNGVSTVRQLNRALHPERHGTTAWNKAYGGLVNGGWLAETGDGTKGSPFQIVLQRVPENDDDEDN